MASATRAGLQTASPERLLRAAERGLPPNRVSRPLLPLDCEVFPGQGLVRSQRFSSVLHRVVCLLNVA